MPDQTDSYRFALELTDFPRSYRAIADALVEAAELEVGTCRHCHAEITTRLLECPHCGVVFDESTWIAREVDHVERAGRFTRGLTDRYMIVDQLAVADVFMAIVGYLAQRTGRTPRQIHEDYFAQAPPDEWWKGRLDEG